MRKFVIISAHATGFVALPIYTFQGKGISARERDQNEYCELVESCSEPPPPNLGVHMQLYMELHPSVRSSGNDLRDKVRPIAIFSRVKCPQRSPASTNQRFNIVS